MPRWGERMDDLELVMQLCEDRDPGDDEPCVNCEQSVVISGHGHNVSLNQSAGVVTQNQIVSDRAELRVTLSQRFARWLTPVDPYAATRATAAQGMARPSWGRIGSPER